MTGGVIGLVLPKGRLLKRRLSGSVIQFWLRPIWLPRRPIYAALRCQLVALATYLPKGYLVAAATYLPKGYLTKLRFRLRLRYQLIALATYLRFATVQRLGLS